MFKISKWFCDHFDNHLGLLLFVLNIGVCFFVIKIFIKYYISKSKLYKKDYLEILLLVEVLLLCIPLCYTNLLEVNIFISLWFLFLCFFL